MAILDKKLLDILVCPVTKSDLVYNEESNELISEKAFSEISSFDSSL